MVGRSSPSLTSCQYPRFRAANALVLVVLEILIEFRLRIDARLACPRFRVLRALLAGMVAVGAEAPAVCLGQKFAILREEVDMVGLLHGAPGEAGIVLDEILEPGFGADFSVAQDRLVPGPVRARPHRVHTGQPADIAGDNAAGGEEEARQRDDIAIFGVLRILRIAPERVIVADAMRIMADIVARGLVAPRLDRLLDLDADALAKLGQSLRRYLRNWLWLMSFMVLSCQIGLWKLAVFCGLAGFRLRHRAESSG